MLEAKAGKGLLLSCLWIAVLGFQTIILQYSGDDIKGVENRSALKFGIMSSRGRSTFRVKQSIKAERCPAAIFWMTTDP